MVDVNLLLIAGGVIAVIGGAICLYWYIYWNRNFQGELLTEGPYAIVRHPFYAGFIMFVLGLTIALPVFEARLLAVFTLAGMAVFVPKEEEQLMKQYKKKYSQYKKKVKWKLIPFIY